MDTKLTVDEPVSLFQRAKTMLLKPKEAWAALVRDMTPSGELFTRYVIPLAAIGPACIFLRSQIFGGPFSGGLFAGLFSAVGNYGFSLVNLLVMSFVASKLAERFGGTASPRNAFKLIAYSSTAAWLAGVFILVPGLSFLSVLAFYSFYLFYEGIGPMMKVPEENKRRFAAITIVSAILLNVATNALIGSPAWHWDRGANWAGPHAVTVEGADFDSSKLRDAARDIRDAVRHGDLKALPADQLQALLPAAIGPFKRTEISTDNSGSVGAKAEGSYEDGDRSFTLRVVDLAGLGAVAQIGSTFGVDHEEKGEHGYEHVTMKNGGMVIEKWDRDDEEGTYATMVGKRFLIEAKGEAPNIDQLKTAVGQIDQTKLIGLAK